MGWPESERGCKKHQYPPHDHEMMKSQTKAKATPSEGVCSFCLSERLSQLYAPSSAIYSLSNHTLIQPFGFSSSSPSHHRHSASSSAPDSPTVQTKQRPRPPHHRTASEVKAKGSISFMIRSRTASTAAGVGGGSYDDHGGVIKKSRSIAVVSKGSTSHIHHFGDHLGKISGGGKKKRGFWSKLLRTKDVFKYSKTSLI